MKVEDLSMKSELPQGWTNTFLGDVCEIKTGKKDVNQGNQNGKYYFFTCAAEPLRSDDYTFEGESILLPGNGANVGLVIYFNGKFDLYQRTYVLNNFSVYGKFLYYYLLGNWTKNLINKQYGSATNYIRLSNITQLEIPIPPFNEQKRIVAKLEKLLGKVNDCQERLEKIPTLLKRFRQSVLAAACSGRLTADWREKNPNVEPAEELLTKFKQSDKYQKVKIKDELPIPFELPSFWKWINLVEGCQSITDGDHQAPPKQDQGIPFLVISNIREGKLDFTNTKYVPKDYYDKLKESRKPVKGDILYSVVGSYGIPVMVEADSPFCFQRHIALLRVNQLLLNTYLFYTLKSQLVFSKATKVATGSAQLTVTLTGLKKIKIPLPPLEEQKEIVRRVEALFKKCDLIEQRYQQAKAYTDKLTQSILAKAFRGELVPQDPNDEPASVLLEKIKAEKAEQEKKPKRKTTKKRSQK